MAVAQTQVGYQEGVNNNNKYSAAFGVNNVEWCAYFVSWCAKEAGISDSIIHRQGIASPFSGYFNVPNTHSSGDYFPKPGDLFFYGPNSNGDHYHVGIVETVNASTGYITTIEGNTNSSGSSTGYIVYRHTRHYQHSTICCYGTPKYTNTSVKHTVDTSYGTNFTAYPKAKITAGNIFNANHSQIDSTSWIGISDKCTIHEVYTDGCCKVTYPLDAGGTKTVYSKISLFNTHTHSYTGARVYESAHPHEITQRCVDYATCGGWKYTGEYYEVKTCEQCWHATFNIGASSVSVKVGESKTVTLTISGCLPDTATLSRTFSPDNNVVEVTSQKQQLTFTGLKAGKTDFSLTDYSDSSKSRVLATITIPVTVTCSNHSYSYKVTTTPTTSATGKLTGTCSKCSATTTVTLPKLSTTNYTYKVAKAATCTTTGTGRYTWKTTTYGSFYFDVSIASKGHSYSTKVTVPTCTTQGYTTHTCSACGNSYNDTYTSSTGHSYSYKVTKAPTTSATGTLTGTCSKCSGTTTVSLPKLSTTNYTYQVTKVATCTAAGTGRYTWKTTTYGSFYFDVSIAATGHSYSAKVTAPTCTAQGYTTHTCSACGSSYKDAYTNATGHSYSYKVTKTPTTSTTGTLTGTCSKCSGTTTVLLPKLSTTNYTYEVAKAATCTATGTGRYTWKTTTYGSFYFEVTIAKLGHSYTTKITAPTCTAQGYTTYTCSRCSDSYKDTYTNATGHNYSNGTISKQPTCKEIGTMIYTCSGCGETKTETIAKLTTHTYDHDCDTSCNICGATRTTSHQYETSWGKVKQTIGTNALCALKKRMRRHTSPVQKQPKPPHRSVLFAVILFKRL